MAAILPPINKNDSNAGPTYALPKGNRLDPLSQGGAKSRRDRASAERNQTLRSQMPILKKKDIAKFRNSYKHNLCLDMLTEGYHMSFCELVNLIRQQMERREAAGPESFLWTKPVLQDQTDKLDMMKKHLTRAEAANRTGDYGSEYKSRFALAEYFKGNEDDSWLVDHFFNTCLDVAGRAEDEGLQAQGHCNVGLCAQANGLYGEAAKHFEAYYKLAKENLDKDWKTASGESYHTDSCIKLYNIYTIIGGDLVKSNDEDEVESGLDTLQKALDTAQESGESRLEGEASYTLGMAFQRHGRLETALSHLTVFYESCRGDSNNEGIGRACDAIAKIYARQGNKEKSVEFLKRFVELTEKTGLEREYCLACHNLGNVCNSVGNYNEATEYFSKAYNISRALADAESTNVNRVQYGIAMAHRMMGRLANHVVTQDKTCMQRLVDWKSVRTDNFAKPIPDTVAGADKHVVLPPPQEQEEPTESTSREEGDGQVEEQE